jgi:hypothetical protein
LIYSLKSVLNVSSNRVILPNPIEEMPVDIFAVTPSFMLDAKDWTVLLNSFSLKKKKRQQALTGGRLNTDDLFALCPVIEALNPEPLAGCIAGLYLKYCYEVDTYGKLAECQRKYDQVFGASIFKTIGQVCPAWKNGPRSLKCKSTIKNFKIDLGYMTVTREYASNLTSLILGSTKIAPCYDINDIKCRWEEEKEPLPSPTVPDGVGFSFPTTASSAFGDHPASTSSTRGSGEGFNFSVLVGALLGGVGALTLLAYFIGYYQGSLTSYFSKQSSPSDKSTKSRRSIKQEDEEKVPEETEAPDDDKPDREVDCDANEKDLHEKAH